MENVVDHIFWRQRNVFVTGGTGLLGSHLVELLVGAGANVTVLVRDWVPKSMIINEGLLQRVNSARGTVEDIHTIERVINEYEVDTVFHLAAQTIVGIANRNPLSTFETNIRGTWNVLEACRRCPTTKRIVVASSDKAYGEQDQLPYTEKTPLSGQYPYDVSKSCTDLIASSYAKSYRLPVCVTRCGNFYGGGDLNFNRLVPGTIRSLLQGEPPIIRSNGSYIRDYLYVKDGAIANLLLAQKMNDLDLLGHAFNFSNELLITVIEFVRRIMQLMNRNDLQPIIRNEAENEIPSQYLSARKARNILGWKPIYDLETGLRETIDWYTRFCSTIEFNVKESK